MAWAATTPATPAAMRIPSSGRRAITRGTLRQQRGSELAPLLHRYRAEVLDEHLDADVVGAGVVVGPHPRHDGVEIAPRHDGVDQPVAAAVDDVFVGEAHPLQVVGVVG